MMITSQENFAPYILKDLKTLLSPQLGTFENGDPAIWIIPPDAPQRGNTLHCYIDRLANRRTDTVYLQRVNLTQYDKTPDGCLAFEKACIKIRNRFSGCEEAILPYRDQLTLEAHFTIPVTRYANGNFSIAVFDYVSA